MEIDTFWLLIIVAIACAIGTHDAGRKSSGTNRNGPPPSDRLKPRPSPPPPPAIRQRVKVEASKEPQP